MLPYSADLSTTLDTVDQLSLDTTHVMKNKKALWFGGVQVKKNYVSYHLMPVYLNPALLDDISTELKKRRQGKSCFNFKAIDPALFRELAELTKAGFEYYKREGYI